MKSSTWGTGMVWNVGILTENENNSLPWGTQTADLQKSLIKKKLKNQKILLSVSNNWIFWNICAFLILLATRSSSEYSSLACSRVRDGVLNVSTTQIHIHIFSHGCRNSMCETKHYIAMLCSKVESVERFNHQPNPYSYPFSRCPRPYQPGQCFSLFLFTVARWLSNPWTRTHQWKQKRTISCNGLSLYQSLCLIPF